MGVVDYFVQSKAVRIQSNDAMLEDLKNGFSGHHASNLGGILAYEIASGLNIPAFIVDPVVVDEMEPIARIVVLLRMERKVSSMH